jgi:prevent-host-death family protein
MVRVTAEEAQSNLPDLIEKAVKGETVVITQDGQQIVQLVPIAYGKAARHPGTAKGMIWMADDFDAPLEDFNEYMSK